MFTLDKELDRFIKATDSIDKIYYKEVKKFMQKEGTKLKNRTLTKAKSLVNKRTGEYFRSIKRGKFYRYKHNNLDSIRVYAGVKARHAHLIEKGYKHKYGMSVKGYHVFNVAAEKFEKTYEANCEKFFDELCEKVIGN